MKENLTELVFVLDRSGSMMSMATEAIGGFNGFLEEQKKLSGEAKLTLVLFDNEYLLVHNGKDLKDVEPLNNLTYIPRGTTALLDAVGRTVDDVGKRLSEMPEQERPSKVLVTILTDGFENASNNYKKSKIKEMILHQRQKYSWEFIFLAANQDAFTEASSMGINPLNSMTYDSNSSSSYSQTFCYASNCATNYRNTGNISGTLVDNNENK